MSSPLTVLITGAGGGLGKATATAFLAAGANVAICDVNAARLDETAKEWIAAGYEQGQRFTTSVTDVTDADAVQRLVTDAATQLGGCGGLDVLVNNAGLQDDFSGVAECSRGMWDKIMAVNLLGPYLLTQAAIRQFEAQAQAAENGDSGSGGGSSSGGVIINICSAAAQDGSSSGAAYTASKHGLLGLSKNTAFHYGDRGIYSIALLLGGMWTNITDSMRNGEIDQAAYARVMSAKTPMVMEKHLVQVETVAKYINFLSDKTIAKSANGSAIDFRNNWPPA
ncbi:unnamed protein product [Discula destructiva]